MGLLAEDLAFDSGLQCEMCSETVNYGDDYVTHLKIVHNIHKNFSFFLNKAKESIKGGNKRKADVITLSDEEEKEEDKNSNDADETNIPVIDEAVKNRIEQVVEKTMREMLTPIRNLLEGKVPLETDNLSAEDLDEDPKASDEKMWEAFNKLKMSINNLEFPEDMLKSLIKENEQEETLTELVTTEHPPAAKKKDDKFKLPSTTQKHPLPQRKGLKTQEKRSQQPEPSSAKDGGTSSKTPARSGLKARTPAAGGARPLLPARSDNSSSASVSGTSSGSSTAKSKATRYCCPLKDCNFTTDKEGLVGGAAANHISRVHKVTAEVMKDAPKGQYKFKKVKQEA